MPIRRTHVKHRKELINQRSGDNTVYAAIVRRGNMSVPSASRRPDLSHECFQLVLLLRERRRQAAAGEVEIVPSGTAKPPLGAHALSEKEGQQGREDSRVTENGLKAAAYANHGLSVYISVFASDVKVSIVVSLNDAWSAKASNAAGLRRFVCIADIL